MKRIVVLLLAILSFSTFAEPLQGNLPAQCILAAWDSNGNKPLNDDVTFCKQFAESAYCHCSKYYSLAFCQRQTVAGIWNLPGSPQVACAMQSEIKYNDCIAQYNYYTVNLSAALKINNKCL